MIESRIPQSKVSQERRIHEPTPQPYAIDFLDSVQFSNAQLSHQWLIEQILVWNQPGVIGGPKKTLKTSLVLDMAISLGSGTPFLGHFPLPWRRRVAVFSGESDQQSLQATALNICAARGVALGECDILSSFQLPRLSNRNQLAGLRAFLEENQVDVVFIDPLYLCLLDGASSISPSNLYEVGPLLWRIADACLGVGTTPILVHHATKNGNKRTTGSPGPLDLDDLAFAGIGEFARQWVLLSRRRGFDPNVGRHELLMSAGGSVGHSGLWNVDVDEGVLGEDFSGRTWEVAVQRAALAEEENPPKARKPGRPRKTGL